MNQSNLWELFCQAQDKLTQASQNPQVGLWILEKYLDTPDDLWSYLWNHKTMEVDFTDNYLQDINDYLDGKPLARILHKTTFYHLELEVHDGVFCPRVETELLVEQALKWIEQNPTATSVCDIGVGSGAIINAVAYHAPHLKAYGNDLNPLAIYCSYQNAKRYDNQISFMLGSNLAPYLDNEIKINCLIANPPYIDIHEPLDTGVTTYDPHLALFAERHGLASYYEIIENAAQVLQKPYVMLFEIGHQQASAVKQILLENGYLKEHISVIQDYQGWDRIIKVVSHV